MQYVNVIAILISLAAFFGFLNHRYFKLPTTIGLMFISIIMSLSMVVLGHLGQIGYGIERQWIEMVEAIDFNKTLMVGMLSFLLFAGALHVDLGELLKRKWQIGIYATMGVIFSTFLIGTLMYEISPLLGSDMRFIDCLLFGALLSPTDPIAILGILKKAGASKDLEIKITGESLFNDGVGVVLFIVMLNLASGEGNSSPSDILFLFGKETLGGIALGLGTGWISYRLLKSIDNYQIEILITLALVTGSYALATAIHTSGPIAIVVAGLLIGNHGRNFAMSEKTRHNLDMFWELIDEILNAVLFVLIGIELLVISLTFNYVLAGLIAIPVALLARAVSIGVPMSMLTLGAKFDYPSLWIMTWGGLRGGISVALALSLPMGAARDSIISMTYIVVVFSIMVQGLTIKRFVKSR